MKALVVAATLASAVMAFAAPLQAASQIPALSQGRMMGDSVERRSHRCDTPAQIAANSICRKL